MPAFYANFRYVLLTYAQCGDLDGFAVMDMLSALEAECIIGREHHADGNYHLHAFVDFGRKFRSRRSDVFDVEGCHPNITPSRGKPGSGYDYAIKDGDVICGGLERPSDGGSEVEGKSAAYHEIAAAENEDEFWDLVRRLVPRDLLLSYPSLRRYADNQFKRTVAEYEHPVNLTFEGGAVSDLSEWRDENISNISGTLGRSVILIGGGSSLRFAPGASG